MDELVEENRALRARIRRLEAASAQVEAAYNVLSEQLSRSGATAAPQPTQLPTDDTKPKPSQQSSLYVTVTSTRLQKEPNSTTNSGTNSTPKLEISPPRRASSGLRPRHHQQHPPQRQQQQE